MRKTRAWLAVLSSSIVLTACSGLVAASSDCNGSDASAVALDIVRDQIIKLSSEREEGLPQLSKSKIRASVKELKLSLVDVRTTKDDPNSSKQFCTGTVRLAAPAQMVLDADETRRMANLNSVEEMADNANVEKSANVFSAEIDFNVQPTDDGEKLFAEIENGNEAFAFFAELVKDHLLKSAVAQAKAEADRLEAEKNAAIAAADQQYQAATLDEAKAQNAAAVQAIGAIWKAIPADARQQMLPMQRAWIKKTDASCKLEAAGQAADATSMQVAKLNCETREQLARAEYLRRFGSAAIDDAYDSNAM